MTVARLLAFAILLSGALFGLERLLGWAEVTSVAGAILFLLGAFIGYGTPSGGHLADKARAGGVTEFDLKLLGSDTRKRFGAGAGLMIIGAVVFCVAILLP